MLHLDKAYYEYLRFIIQYIQAYKHIFKRILYLMINERSISGYTKDNIAFCVIDYSKMHFIKLFLHHLLELTNEILILYFY